MVGWPVRDAVTDPRTNLGADIAGFVIFSAGHFLQLHRTESLQIFFSVKGELVFSDLLRGWVRIFLLQQTF